MREVSPGDVIYSFAKGKLQGFGLEPVMHFDRAGF